MKILQLLIFIPVFLLSSIVTAQSTSEKLRVIERNRLRALVHSDMVAADSLHAADFQLINPFGGAMSKDQYLGRIWAQDIRKDWLKY